jgi:hypothetical protein
MSDTQSCDGDRGNSIRYLRVTDGAANYEEQQREVSPPPEDAIPDWLASLLWWPVTFLGFLLRLVRKTVDCSL